MAVEIEPEIPNDLLHGLEQIKTTSNGVFDYFIVLPGGIIKGGLAGKKRAIKLRIGAENPKPLPDGATHELVWFQTTTLKQAGSSSLLKSWHITKESEQKRITGVLQHLRGMLDAVIPETVKTAKPPAHGPTEAASSPIKGHRQAARKRYRALNLCRNHMPSLG